MDEIKAIEKTEDDELIMRGFGNLVKKRTKRHRPIKQTIFKIFTKILLITRNLRKVQSQLNKLSSHKHCEKCGRSFLFSENIMSNYCSRCDKRNKN